MFRRRWTNRGFYVMYDMYKSLVILVPCVRVLSINKYIFIKVPFDTKKFSFNYSSVPFQNLNFATVS